MEIRKRKILIIDDEIDLATTLKFRLEVNNFDVDFACDPMDGILKATTAKPELILLDLTMPLMNGYQVCQKLKSDKNTAGIPIIILTAMADEASARQALKAGAQGYLAKPFEAEALLFTVRKILKA